MRPFIGIIDSVLIRKGKKALRDIEQSKWRERFPFGTIVKPVVFAAIRQVQALFYAMIPVTWISTNGFS